jgi:hypothetical protein
MHVGITCSWPILCQSSSLSSSSLLSQLPIFMHVGIHAVGSFSVNLHHYHHLKHSHHHHHYNCYHSYQYLCMLASMQLANSLLIFIIIIILNILIIITSGTFSLTVFIRYSKDKLLSQIPF